MTDLPEWARNLDLQPHPEGGWYRETWRSELTLPASALPHRRNDATGQVDSYPGARSAGTAILFLLPPGECSAWHTVRGAELWLHHRGGPLRLDVAGDGPAPGPLTSTRLGGDITGGESPQALVPPAHWQRAEAVGDEATLVSCVVVPGFDFADFRLHTP
ncbi:cupin domain-containing protein [Rhodococcus triatomae]|nr:hypothetical protein G419_21307 [Rhodococcus triatomae BKS 15-14]